jgi:rhodanese-related sulfurtransferase
MKTRRSLPLAPLLAVPVAIWACAGDPDGHIAAADLAARIEAGTAPPVVDVRSGGEYRAGHVPGAIHLGFLSAFGRSGELALPREQPVVVYCEHGPRAGIARFALHRHGFERVVLLDGHMKGWRRAGLPIEVPEAPAGKRD